MKPILLISLLLLSVGAFGQCCLPFMTPPPMASSVRMPEHPLQATPHGLAAEHDLREVGSVMMAQGERPVWEVYHPVETPLGDAARDYRQQHEAVEKASVVWEQDGHCPACLRSAIRRCALRHKAGSPASGHALAR
jgi:hypothetical protein